MAPATTRTVFHHCNKYVPRIVAICAVFQLFKRTTVKISWRMGSAGFSVGDSFNGHNNISKQNVTWWHIYTTVNRLLKSTVPSHYLNHHWLIRFLQTNCSEIWIKVQFSSTGCIWKCCLLDCNHIIQGSMCLRQNVEIYRWCSGYNILDGCCFVIVITWWRHQMATFSTLLPICAGDSPVTGEFPAQLWCFLWPAPE